MATTFRNDVTSYDAAYADLMEWVPDLMWPTSVQTYGQMRTDPQLRAILQAYSLPIRRASWAVDGTGCRPEAARLVGDSLGLPVKGSDARPARGPVRFAQVNRLAMLHLVFGHMPFEKVYDVTDGMTARLAGLYERMPQSITRIDLDDQDQLLGIEQYARQGSKGPVIGRESLVWHAHEREGGAWQGRSLLRDAYGAWLIKREMWRVNASSLRRNGMGVPVVTAPLGATPAQIVEAQRLASAHRGGDRSGVGLPSGFIMELKGITGSVPDPLPFINYLDQQMSRAALAGVVDLGNTSNGSRALGDTFVDLLMLSLQAVADDVADVWTADVAADLIRLNYGDQEPVPVITVGDVGESHEVTAATLQTLLASGALSASPELEAYVREQWKLPAPTPPAAPVPVPSPSTPGDTPTPGAGAVQDAVPAPVAASVWPFRRQLTTVEARALVDPVTIDEQWQTAVETALQAWATTYAPQLKDAILNAVAAAFKDGPQGFADLTVDLPPDVVAGITQIMLTVAQQAQVGQVEEAVGQGVDLPGPPDLPVIDLQAFAGSMLQLLVKSMVTTASRKAIAAYAAPGATKDDVEAQVAGALDTLTLAQPRDTFGAIMSYGQGQGRSSVLATAPAGTYVASEIMDANTCGPCAAIDGTVFPSREAADAAYASGGYSECAGGLRCRGIVVTTWD